MRIGSVHQRSQQRCLASLPFSSQHSRGRPIAKNHTGDVFFLHSVDFPNGTHFLQQKPEAFLGLLQQMDSCTPILTAGTEQLSCHGLGSLLSSNFVLKTSVELGSLPVIYLKPPKLIGPKVMPVTEGQQTIKAFILTRSYLKCVVNLRTLCVCGAEGIFYDR